MKSLYLALLFLFGFLLPPAGFANEPAPFVRTVTVSNETGRAIFVATYLFVGRPGRSTDETAFGRGESIGFSRQPAVINAGSKATLDLSSYLRAGNGKYLAQPAAFVYLLQSYYDDGRREPALAINISNKAYSGGDLDRAGNVVIVARSRSSDEELLRRDARSAATARAQDPDERGTLTVINWRGETIVCELRIPKRHLSSDATKLRFVLGATKGSKHAIPNLRLFGGYSLMAAKSENDLDNGTGVMHDAAPGRFQMEQNKVINIGRPPSSN